MRRLRSSIFCAGKELLLVWILDPLTYKIFYKHRIKNTGGKGNNEKAKFGMCQ